MATAVKISGAKMDSKSANTWKKDFSCNGCQSIIVRAIESRGLWLLPLYLLRKLLLIVWLGCNGRGRSL